MQLKRERVPFKSDRMQLKMQRIRVRLLGRKNEMNGMERGLARITLKGGAFKTPAERGSRRREEADSLGFDASASSRRRLHMRFETSSSLGEFGLMVSPL